MATADDASERQPSKLPDFANWMGQLPEELHSIQLNRLAIPGSHDSASFCIDKNGPIGPDMGSAMQDMAKVLGPLVKDIMARWSLTQSKTLAQQLEAGIRYLDLRIASRPGTRDVYTVHGLYNQKLETNLQDINAFVETHPKEIVLLDFNHLFVMDESMHSECMTMILEIFGSKVCLLLDMESMTLDTLWENGLQVVVFYHNELAKDNVMFWSNDHIRSPYADTDSVEKLVAFLESDHEKPRPEDTFHVTQGILTPSPGYIISHMMGTLKDDLAAKVAPPFVDWLRSKKPGAGGINICLMDFVERDDFIAVVIGLNKKLLKEHLP